MKLSIHSDVITGITNLLQKDKLLLSLGKMTRNKFIPFVNNLDINNIEKHIQKYPMSECSIGNISKEIFDIGFISSPSAHMHDTFYHIIIYSAGKDPIPVKRYSLDTYDIIVADKSVFIEFTIVPNNLQSFFNPIKKLYSFLKSPIQSIFAPLITSAYNDLIVKHTHNIFITHQKVRYIRDKDKVNLKKYMVAPQKSGDIFSMFIHSTGVYFISSIHSLFRFEHKSPKGAYNTIITGDWYENSFTCYDISVVNGKNITKFSLIKRLKYLQAVVKRFPYCKIAKYMDYNSENVSTLLESYNGVLLCPIEANYFNNRTYIYQPIQKVSVHFNVEKKGFFYNLKTNGLGKFSGTKKYPYMYQIPLTREDREFIQSKDTVIFEFRWENDGFVPYQRSRRIFPSDTTESENIWNYINNPVYNLA